MSEYKCEKCKSNTKKTVTLCDLKDILLIQLMCFSFDGTAAKLYNRITFPRTLDMSKYVAKNVSECEDEYDGSDEGGNDDNYGEETTYNLVGVIMHSGVVRTGHYYCFLKNTTTEEGTEWLRFDDKSVRTWDIDKNFDKDCIGSGDDESPTPYVLVYSRQSKQCEGLEAKRCRFEQNPEEGTDCTASGRQEWDNSADATMARITKENAERDILSSAFNMNYIDFVRKLYEAILDRKYDIPNDTFVLAPIYYMQAFCDVASSTEFNLSWLTVIKRTTENNKHVTTFIHTHTHTHTHIK